MEAPLHTTNIHIINLFLVKSNNNLHIEPRRKSLNDKSIRISLCPCGTETNT